MQLTCLADRLAQAFNLIKPVVAPKHKDTHLHHTLVGLSLDQPNRSLLIHGHGPHLSAQTRIPAAFPVDSPTIPRHIAIRAGDLDAALNHAAANSVLAMDIADDPTLHLYTGTQPHLEIPAFSAFQTPPPLPHNLPHIAVIDTQELIDALAATIQQTSDIVTLNLTEKRLRVSAHSHQYSSQWAGSLQSNTRKGRPQITTVPGHTLVILSALLKASSPHVHLSRTADTFYVTNGFATYAFTDQPVALPGHAPSPWYLTQTQFATDQLLDAVSLLAALSVPPTIVVTLQVEPKSITVSTNTIRGETINIAVPAETTGPDRIFNAPAIPLIRALRNTPAPAAVIRIASNNDPFVIRPVDNNSIRHSIAPTTQ